LRHIANPLLLLCLLSSCSGPDVASFAQAHTTPDERAFARGYLGLLAAGQTDSAVALLDPSLRNDTTVRALQVVGALLRDARLDSLHIIGARAWDHLFLGSAPRAHDLNLSYEVPTASGGWLATNVATRSVVGQRSVIGVSARPIPGRLEAINAFTWAGKSGRHYLWLALAGLMPLITLTMATRVIMAKGMPRRWLWAIGALVASPAFVLNWTTGQMGLTNGVFILFGGAVDRAGAAAPWTVTFAVPIGTAVAHLRFRAWRDAHVARAARLPDDPGLGAP
jgi:hypothetical protein